MRLSPDGAAFLDRDGTINVKAPEGAYIERPEDVHLLPGAAAAVRRLNDAGIPVLLVTNQRGIALGRMTEDDLARVHARLADELEREAGAHLDDVEHCPHDRDACSCRKPAPGMLLALSRRHPAVDLPGSVVVGDAASDIEAGRRAGTLAVALAREGTGADHVAPDLAAAVDWVLGA